ncbi:MAG: hypothetical protein Q8R79_07710 [Legionellaceae bacterium]|nr:hypothetical protein [Legionellaceae bacterium]
MSFFRTYDFIVLAPDLQNDFEEQRFERIDQQQLSDTLVELLQGSYTSKNIKPIEKDVIYMRINDKYRLIFSAVQYEGKFYAVVHQCLLTHVMEDIPAAYCSYHELKMRINRVFKEGTRYILEEGKLKAYVPEVIALPVLARYKNRMVGLNLEQQDALRPSAKASKTIEIISGPPGAGKSLLALEKIVQAVLCAKDSPELTQIYYLTPTEEMINLMQRQWQSHPVYNECPEQVNVHILSFAAFLKTREFTPPGTRIVDSKAFQYWYAEQTPPENLAHISTNRLYQEFRNLLGLKDYASLQLREVLLFQEETPEARKVLRNSVLSLFKRYQQFLQDNYYVDPDLCLLPKDLLMASDTLIMDESQNLPWHSITQLYVADTTLLMNVSQAAIGGHSTETLLRHWAAQHQVHLQFHNLKSAHRCPIALLEVAQHTLDLIPMINPNQKHAITADRNLLQMPSSTLHAGKRFWVEPSKEALAQIHRS